MAYFYMNTDTGSNANDGTTWALSKLTFEGLLAVLAPGDIGVIQGAAIDSVAGTRTFTFQGTPNDPCKILGVKTGTTNTGANITVSDLAIRGTDTLTQVIITGATNDINFAGNAQIFGISFTCVDRLSINDILDNIKFISCILILPGPVQTNEGSYIFLDCEIQSTGTAFRLWTRKNEIEKPIQMFGGLINFIISPSQSLVHPDLAFAGILFQGVDLSNMANIALLGNNNAGTFDFINCSLPTNYSLSLAPFDNDKCELRVIGSTSDSSIPDTDSIQDFKYRSTFGDIYSELVIVRTGGANDNASGLFSYAMTPASNGVLEGSPANLKSPWLSVWVQAGTKTLTVFIANSAVAAATDYFEDEVWCEFYTPNQNDTAKHELNIYPGLSRLLESAIPVTDDIGSVWGPGGNNHQKFSITVSPGFEGVAYARVHLAKRQLTPDTLYLDPKIDVV